MHTIPDEGTWFLVLNPAAGGGRGKKLLPEIESALNEAQIKYSLHLTTEPGEAIWAVQEAIAAGLRNIIAAGGDGTFHEVANGILTQSIVDPSALTLALIPAGTGNDWPRTWQIPSDIKGAVRVLSEGHTCLQSAGLIQYHLNGLPCTRWFVNVAGCGFDAAVAAAANKAKENGRSGYLTYVFQLVQTLFRYKEVASHLQINQQSILVDLFAVLAGIGKYAGNGMMLVPEANPASNQFSITLVKKIPRLKVVRNLPKLFNGRFTTMREVSILQGSKLAINAGRNLLLQADGESLGEAPVTFEIFPARIKLVVPRPNQPPK
ncbi:MAG: diacylglycerol kinase family lipid kinase [Bacteroidia bacterium]|jgi:diacylglycerol kinase (ATP)|nr:diacylglycerol kinase family lipid kinase [Bacteroidia bacterium]MCC6767787.1 diacylglycerol kinase family lipid kinase [Bacteroidia bacterium]